MTKIKKTHKKHKLTYANTEMLLEALKVLEAAKAEKP